VTDKVSADKGQPEEVEKEWQESECPILPLVGGEPQSEGATVGKDGTGRNELLIGNTGGDIEL